MTKEVAPFMTKCASTLNFPYPQPPKSSKKIVFQYGRECSKLFLKNLHIPLVISGIILEHYHSNIMYPVLSPSHINTEYNIGDQVKVFNEVYWSIENGTVCYKHDNWISIQYDTTTEPLHLHLIKSNVFIRRVINEGIVNQLAAIGYKLVDIKVADKQGYGLFGIFVTEIIDHPEWNPGFLSDFRTNCQKWYKKNMQYFVDLVGDEKMKWIQILSDFCNVGVDIHEFDKENGALFVTHKFGLSEEKQNIPIISLLKDRNSYYLIRNKKARYGRPLETFYKMWAYHTMNTTNDKPNLFALRLKRRIDRLSTSLKALT